MKKKTGSSSQPITSRKLIPVWLASKKFDIKPCRRPSSIPSATIKLGQAPKGNTNSHDTEQRANTG